MNEPEKWVIAYWLLPAPLAREFFRQTIELLAAKYDAPFFEPHLTLAVHPDSPDDASRLFAQIPRRPIELQTMEVAWTAVFTRTLFVRFDSSPLLGQLRDSLGAGEYQFDPHLSLLYQKIPEEEQARLAAEIQLPFSRVTFDAVAAMRCRVPVASPADVAVWESVARKSLVGEKAG